MANFLQNSRTKSICVCIIYGLLLPLAFAPFHIPGMAVISLGLLYFALNQITSTKNQLHGFLQGMAFGLGFFGLGASWIYVSIHDYGHLNSLISGLITLFFIVYLALFPAVMGLCYRFLHLKPYSLFSIVVFAALWTGSEYLRSNVLTGFPWLLVGVGQIDAPVRALLPFTGIYGVSFLICIASGIFILIFQQPRKTRLVPVCALITIMLAPLLLQHTRDLFITNSFAENTHAKPITVGIVQANISMRDKWDEQLFWQLLNTHEKNIQQLLGTQLIVLPEAAIPMPASYIQDILKNIANKAKQSDSAILLGIPETTEFNDATFYNTLMGLGQAQGTYLKQHLVPFGEYIPKPFQTITKWLQLPDANMQPGYHGQKLIKVHHIPIATLICYELAYGHLLRGQLPTAQFIVSISDDGWFGHSLAVYQHQQIAEVQSLQTDRYQVVANNDGLSTIIDAQGHVITALAPFTAGIIKATISPKTTLTPWVRFGDTPVLAGLALIISLALLMRRHNRLLPSTRRGAILTTQTENNE